MTEDQIDDLISDGWRLVNGRLVPTPGTESQREAQRFAALEDLDPSPGDQPQG